MTKYAPLGVRGVGLGRATGYGADFQRYLENANEETAVVVQAEHIQAVENIQEIVQGYTLIVAGVDTLMLGAQAQKILQQLSG